MGANSSSHFSSITRIHKQLLDIEQTQANLEASDLWRKLQIKEGMAAGATCFARRDDIFLYGAALACRPDVKVVMGPIIGAVTENSVRILLEVDRSNVDVTCHVCFCSTQLPSGRVVCKQTRRMVGGQPTVFQLDGLRPGQRYNVCFSGVCRDDAVERVARFNSMGGPLRERMTMAFVSCNRQEDVRKGGESLWETLAHTITRPKDYEGAYAYDDDKHTAHGCDYVVHLGSQVQPPRGPPIGDWEGLKEIAQRRALERVRTYWRFPQTRAVLSHCANLPLCGEGELRLGRETFERYQRQLLVDLKPKLNESKLGEFADVETHHYLQVVGCVGILALHLQGGRPWSDVPNKSLNAALLCEEQWKDLDRLMAVQRVRALIICTEFPVVHFGSAELGWVLENSETTAPFLKASWSNPKYKNDTIRLLSLLFAWQQSHPGRQCLIVGGGVRAGGVTTITDATTGATLRQLTVGAITDEPQPFLPQFDGSFDGKGKRFSWVHSPIAQRNCYGEVTVKKVGDVEWPNWQGVNIELELVRANDRVPLPRVVMGPVVGKCTSTSAVVVLEVDRPGAVSCVLEDTLARGMGASNRFVRTHSVEAYTPTAFFLNGLKSGRRYEVSFEGISDPAEFRGIATTLPVSGTRPFCMVFVNDNNREQYMAYEQAMLLAKRDSGTLAQPDARPWDVLRHKVQGKMWEGPDVVFHTGSQVHMGARMTSTNIRALESEYSGLTLERKAQVLRDARKQLTEAYRFNWAFPSTRAVLSTCSNIMMWGHGDVSPSFGRSYCDTPPFLLQASKKAFHLYQRQLYDPFVGLRRNAGSTPGASEHHLHVFNAVAVFVFDLRGHRLDADLIHRRDAPFVNQAQWKALEEALRLTSVRTMVLVSEEPFVKDSPEDAKIKESMDPACTDLRHSWPYNSASLERLLTMLFKWKIDKASEREVILICNGNGFGVRTKIVTGDVPKPDSAAGPGHTNRVFGKPVTIMQYMVPSISGPPIAAFACEQKGSLFGAYAYEHIVEGTEASFSTLKITPRPGQSDQVTMDVISNLGSDMHDIPSWIADKVMATDVSTATKLQLQEEQEIAFKTQEMLSTPGFKRAVSADSDATVAEWIVHQEPPALEALRVNYHRQERVRQWHKVLRSFYFRGCCGSTRAQLAFPSDDVVRTVLDEKVNSYPEDMAMQEEHVVGMAIDMFVKQALVSHRMNTAEREEREAVAIRVHANPAEAADGSDLALRPGEAKKAPNAISLYT